MSQLGPEKKKEKPTLSARSVSIKRVVTEEMDYEILEGEIPAKYLKKALQSGEFYLVQSELVEPNVYVVDGQGNRVAILGKTGGMGPDHKVTVTVR